MAFLAYAFAAMAATARPTPVDAAQPDVLISAVAHARELRFEIVPDVKVTFLGQPGNTNVWHTDRENLPEAVAPHVLYRDIGIRLTISSTLPDIEQIVDEALKPDPQKSP